MNLTLRRRRSGLERAVANAQAGLCLFNTTGEPCPRTRRRGLRDDDDLEIVLICKGHAARLLKLRRTGEIEPLHRALRAGIASRRGLT